MLHFSTVEPDTLELLRQIQQDPAFQETLLVGGTALALQLGHRVSVDLDFFGHTSVSGLELEQLLRAHGPVALTRRSRLVEVYTVRGIKVDFVQYDYPWLEAPTIHPPLRLASLKDIAAMKLSAITNRGTKRDFVDLAFLLEKFSLDDMLGFYQKKYKDASLFLVLKSLVFFEDAEDDPLPRMLAPFDWHAARQRIVDAVAAAGRNPREAGKELP